jgi:hypothetical protein
LAPTTSYPGLAGIDTLIGGGNDALVGDGNDTFEFAAPLVAPAAGAFSHPNRCFNQAHRRYLFGLDANVQSKRIRLLAPRVWQGVGGRWEGCR